MLIHIHSNVIRWAWRESEEEENKKISMKENLVTNEEVHSFATKEETEKKP